MDIPLPYRNGLVPKRRVLCGWFLLVNWGVDRILVVQLFALFPPGV